MDIVRREGLPGNGNCVDPFGGGWSCGHVCSVLPIEAIDHRHSDICEFTVKVHDIFVDRDFIFPEVEAHDRMGLFQLHFEICARNGPPAGMKQRRIDFVEQEVLGKGGVAGLHGRMIFRKEVLEQEHKKRFGGFGEAGE